MKTKHKVPVKPDLLGDLFPKGGGKDLILELLDFLREKKVKTEADITYGLPSASLNIKCFLPKQWTFDERDEVTNQINKTKDLLSYWEGWEFDINLIFPKKGSCTNQVRFEIRWQATSPMPGEDPVKGRESFKDFMLNEYPKMVKEKGFEAAEDMREDMAQVTRMDSYFKNRVLQQLVDEIDTVKTLDAKLLYVAFNVLITKGMPSIRAVDKLKKAARRRGYHEQVIKHAVEKNRIFTGVNLKSMDDIKPLSPQQWKAIQAEVLRR